MNMHHDDRRDHGPGQPGEDADDSLWAIPGPAGIPGATGATGAAGANGPMGPPGEDGEDADEFPLVPVGHSILTHQGFPGGTSTFLRADGTFGAVTATVLAEWHIPLMDLATEVVI